MEAHSGSTNWLTNFSHFEGVHNPQVELSDSNNLRSSANNKKLRVVYDLAYK